MLLPAPAAMLFLPMLPCQRHDAACRCHDDDAADLRCFRREIFYFVTMLADADAATLPYAAFHDADVVAAAAQLSMSLRPHHTTRVMR